MLRDVEKVYPTSPAKSNTTSKHYRSRVNSGTVPTTFHHTRAHSITRDGTIKTPPTRYGNTAQPHNHPRENTAVFPTFRFWSGCNRGGYILLPPPGYIALRSKICAKETPSVQCAETTLANSTIPPSRNMMYRYGYPTTIPPSGCLHKLTTHSYSPETQQN